MLRWRSASSTSPTVTPPKATSSSDLRLALALVVARLLPGGAWAVAGGARTSTTPWRWPVGRPDVHATMIADFHYASRSRTECFCPTIPRCATSRKRCSSPSDPATISRWLAGMRSGFALVFQYAPADVSADWSCWPQVREAVRAAAVLPRPMYRSSTCTSRRRWPGIGDLDGAIELRGQSIDDLFRRGTADVSRACATGVLVEIAAATAGQRATWRSPGRDRAAGGRPADDGLVRDIWLLRLRALLARAHGDEAGYRDYRDRYRAMATSLGFEGHMKWAEAMP